MTNGKVRFFSVAIAGILAGCSALDSILGKKAIPSKSRKSIQVNSPAPSATSGLIATDPTLTPTFMPTSTTRPCPTDGSRIAFGTLWPLPGGVGQALTFRLTCGVGTQDLDEKPEALMSIGDRLWLFTENDKLNSANSSIFRMEGVKSGSIFFSQPNEIENVRFSEQTLPGDVKSRASSSLTFTEQGRSRFGNPTFEWPCAKDDEYTGAMLTESNPDPIDLSPSVFAVGDRYVVRSVGEYHYELDGNGDRWLTARKVIQAVRRDGRAFKIIRKYQWPDGEVLDRYKGWAMYGGSGGMDSFVWSVQLKAFVRNPYGFGLFELRENLIYQFEVLTEGDLDTLLAANEGSPCGIE